MQVKVFCRGSWKQKYGEKKVNSGHKLAVRQHVATRVVKGTPISATSVSALLSTQAAVLNEITSEPLCGSHPERKLEPSKTAPQKYLFPSCFLSPSRNLSKEGAFLKLLLLLLFLAITPFLIYHYHLSLFIISHNAAHMWPACRWTLLFTSGGGGAAISGADCWTPSSVASSSRDRWATPSAVWSNRRSEYPGCAELWGLLQLYRETKEIVWSVCMFCESAAS